MSPLLGLNVASSCLQCHSYADFSVPTLSFFGVILSKMLTTPLKCVGNHRSCRVGLSAGKDYRMC